MEERQRKLDALSKYWTESEANMDDVLMKILNEKFESADDGFDALKKCLTTTQDDLKSCRERQLAFYRNPDNQQQFQRLAASIKEYEQAVKTVSTNVTTSLKSKEKVLMAHGDRTALKRMVDDMKCRKRKEEAVSSKESLLQSHNMVRQIRNWDLPRKTAFIIQVQKAIEALVKEDVSQLEQLNATGLVKNIINDIKSTAGETGIITKEMWEFVSLLGVCNVPGLIQPGEDNIIINNILRFLYNKYNNGLPTWKPDGCLKIGTSNVVDFFKKSPYCERELGARKEWLIRTPTGADLANNPHDFVTNILVRVTSLRQDARNIYDNVMKQCPSKQRRDITEESVMSTLGVYLWDKIRECGDPIVFIIIGVNIAKCDASVQTIMARFVHDECNNLYEMCYKRLKDVISNTLESTSTEKIDLDAVLCLYNQLWEIRQMKGVTIDDHWLKLQQDVNKAVDESTIARKFGGVAGLYYRMKGRDALKHFHGWFTNFVRDNIIAGETSQAKMRENLASFMTNTRFLTKKTTAVFVDPEEAEWVKQTVEDIISKH